MARFKAPRKVEVVWFDAVADGERARTAAEVEAEVQLIERHTTGYIAFEDSARLVVAQTFDPGSGRYDDLIAIPAPWVRRKRRK